MKKPFLHALAAALYIVVIVFVASTLGSIIKGPDTIMAPMTMLSLFVLSAAVMGYLFLSEPLQLLMKNKNQEAIAEFGKVVGFFACFVVLYTVILFFIQQ